LASQAPAYAHGRGGCIELHVGIDASTAQMLGDGPYIGFRQQIARWRHVEDACHSLHSSGKFGEAEVPIVGTGGSQQLQSAGGVHQRALRHDEFADVVVRAQTFGGEGWTPLKRRKTVIARDVVPCISIDHIGIQALSVDDAGHRQQCITGYIVACRDEDHPLCRCIVAQWDPARRRT
jgi:hypothetical protein